MPTVYDQLGDKFKDDDSVVIARIDAKANILEHTKLKVLPTYILYKKETNQVRKFIISVYSNLRSLGD